MIIVIKGGVVPGFLQGNVIGVFQHQPKTERLIIRVAGDGLDNTIEYIIPFNNSELSKEAVNQITEALLNNPSIITINFSFNEEDSSKLPLISWEPIKESSSAEPNLTGCYSDALELHDAITRSLIENKLEIIYAPQGETQASLGVESFRTFVWSAHKHLQEILKEKEPG